MFLCIHAYWKRMRAGIWASSDRQSCKTAKCLLLLHGETNLTLMRNEDIRKHLGTTAAENHLCALSSFSYWQAAEAWLVGFSDRMGLVQDDKSQVSWVWKKRCLNNAPQAHVGAQGRHLACGWMWTDLHRNILNARQLCPLILCRQHFIINGKSLSPPLVFNVITFIMLSYFGIHGDVRCNSIGITVRMNVH